MVLLLMYSSNSTNLSKYEYTKILGQGLLNSIMDIRVLLQEKDISIIHLLLKKKLEESWYQLLLEDLYGLVQANIGYYLILKF